MFSAHVVKVLFITNELRDIMRHDMPFLMFTFFLPSGRREYIEYMKR